MDDHPRDRIALMSSVEVEMWKELQSTSGECKNAMCFGSSATSTDNLFNRRPTDEQRMMSHAHTNRQCKRSLDHRRILSPSKPRLMDCVALGARPESHQRVSPKIPHRNGIAAHERGRMKVDCDDAMVESQTEGHICFKKCLAMPRQVWAAVASPLCLSRPVYEALDPVCLA